VNRDFSFHLPIWLLCLLCLLLMLAFSEAGFRAGRRSRTQCDEAMRSRITIFESAILGVLGLLMGFTISMAVVRFDLRRQLVVAEANAIGTTWLRSKTMPAPDNAEFAGLLREYVNVRLRYVPPMDLDHMHELREEGRRLQDELWLRATGFALRDQRSVPAGLLLQSLNQSIDLEASRWAAFWARVPQSVIFMNLLIALLGATLLGYDFGLIGKRHMLSMVMLAIAISGVLTVIIDLDRPWQGLILVSQQPMIDLQKQLANSR
jgi:hypothetical protein